MVAGKGIFHAEMPGSWTEEAEGLQLWFNLPIKEKYCEAGYVNFKANEVPNFKEGNVDIKLISGQYKDHTAKVVHQTPSYYLILEMKPWENYEHAIPNEWNSFAYIAKG